MEFLNAENENHRMPVYRQRLLHAQIRDAEFGQACDDIVHREDWDSVLAPSMEEITSFETLVDKNASSNLTVLKEMGDIIAGLQLWKQQRSRHGVFDAAARPDATPGYEKSTDDLVGRSDNCNFVECEKVGIIGQGSRDQDRDFAAVEQRLLKKLSMAVLGKSTVEGLRLRFLDRPETISDEILDPIKHDFGTDIFQQMNGGPAVHDGSCVEECVLAQPLNNTATSLAAIQRRDDSDNDVKYQVLLSALCQQLSQFVSGSSATQAMPTHLAGRCHVCDGTSGNHVGSYGKQRSGQFKSLLELLQDVASDSDSDSNSSSGLSTTHGARCESSGIVPACANSNQLGSPSCSSPRLNQPGKPDKRPPCTIVTSSGLGTGPDRATSSHCRQEQSQKAQGEQGEQGAQGAQGVEAKEPHTREWTVPPPALGNRVLPSSRDLEAQFRLESCEELGREARRGVREDEAMRRREQQVLEDGADLQGEVATLAEELLGISAEIDRLLR